MAVGTQSTAPLPGVLYLASELTGLPFTPYDIFHWTTQELHGSTATFGLKVMIGEHAADIIRK